MSEWFRVVFNIFRPFLRTEKHRSSLHGRPEACVGSVIFTPYINKRLGAGVERVSYHVTKTALTILFMAITTKKRALW